MYCPKCGKENPEGAQLCIACSWVLTSTSTGPSPDAKTSGLAITSFVLGILSIFTLFLTVLPAIICGIAGLVKISKSEGRLKGKGLAIAGMALPAAALPVIAILLAILMPALSKTKMLAQRLVCGANIRQLTSAIFIYANNYDDKFPTADQWCDLLISKADVPEKSFNCKSAPPGTFCYAINKNLDGLRMGDIHLDTVMLFEITGGRNIAGGAELLSTERHRGVGCNIAFVDGHVQFIRTENIGQLKWAADKHDIENEQSQPYPEY